MISFTILKHVVIITITIMIIITIVFIIIKIMYIIVTEADYEYIQVILRTVADEPLRKKCSCDDVLCRHSPAQ